MIGAGISNRKKVAEKNRLERVQWTLVDGPLDVDGERLARKIEADCCVLNGDYR